MAKKKIPKKHDEDAAFKRAWDNTIKHRDSMKAMLERIARTAREMEDFRARVEAELECKRMNKNGKGDRNMQKIITKVEEAIKLLQEAIIAMSLQNQMGSMGY